MKHLKNLDLMGSFPWDMHPAMREAQKLAFNIISQLMGSVTLEAPTGSGKTAIGITALKALDKAGKKSLFYIVPTKSLVEQIKRLYPEVKVVFGRNEYQCLFYQNEYVSADQSPCALITCPHRLRNDGTTEEPGATPCPYLAAKLSAKQGGTVVCTSAFYLFTHLFRCDEWPIPDGLVIDEAHGIAKIVRSCLSYEITDFYLVKIIDFLKDIDPASAGVFQVFLDKMVGMMINKPANKETILEDFEIRELMNELVKINPKELKAKIRVAAKIIQNREEKREILKVMERIALNLNRYIRDLEFSLPTGNRAAFKYTCAYYKKELKGREKAQYQLFIKAFKVDGLIQRLLSPFTIAYSATIGDAQTFKWETGIDAPFYTLPSEFPVENTRIFMPTDTPNLAVKERRKRDPVRTIRMIARSCKELADKRIRSLVIVISELERQKFLAMSKEEGFTAISYGNGKASREAVREFVAGDGDVLVGTAANYGEGIDLPEQIAPVIFFLRPGYPRPDDPLAIFEEKRWGSRRWALWNWRVMIEALQVRGRNVRSSEDLGVCFFFSQQFRRFLFSALPDWLKQAYIGSLNFQDCLEEGKSLIS